MTPALPRLIVFPPSHFCERARWALDNAGIAYSEARWAVGVHLPLIKRLAPASTLPILDVGGTVIQGSDRILDWTRLAGADEAVETRFEQQIAPLVRQYLYATLLADRRSGVLSSLLDGVPRWQRVACRTLWPITRRMMAASMAAHPEIEPVLKGRLDAEFTWFEQRLGSAPYLGGESFGRADLTAASLLSPLAMPAHGPSFRHVRLRAHVAATLADWRQRPALRWVSRVYEQHRRSARGAAA
jgi:glutathione S-transferase